MMQVSKKIPFDDPNVLNMCRAAYLASNLIILCISLYIKSVVDKKKGTHLCHYRANCTLIVCAQYARELCCGFSLRCF
jgi:Protein involved in inorganic phosphate transport